MPEPSFIVDAVRLESRLATIEAKLSDDTQRNRLGVVEAELKGSAMSLVRIDERFRSLPSEKEFSDLRQRLARLETQVAHLPSKGFIINIVTTIGAIVGIILSFGKLKAIFGL